MFQEVLVLDNLFNRWQLDRN